MSLKACLLRYWPDYLADMIGGLKSYSNYRPSGVTWVGEVPDHWSVVHLRYLIECLDGRRVPLSSEQRGAMQGGIPYWGANSVIDLVNDWLFDEPLVLLGEDGAPFFDSYRPVCFFTSGKIWVNNHAHVLRCSERVHPEFLVHALNSVDYISFISGSTRDKLTQQAMGAISIQLPPLSEQAAIVSYLEHAGSRVRRYISAKERLIELLTEQKQAIINQAVTRGLDSNVPLKPSGVEWIGDVPVHWEIARFSRQISIAEGQVDPTVEPYASMPLIAPNHLEARTGRLSDQETASEQGAISSKFLCRAGDVIYSKIRPALAKVVLAPTDCLCSADMYPLRPRHSLQANYLFWLLLSEAFTAWSVLESDRVAMPKINRATLNSYHIPVPPLPEQAAIVRHLDEAVTNIYTATDSARRQIELMQEYRTRLITDVVTGKLDVRGAVAYEAEVPPP